jgi:outer membrane lipoprotein-sorting protein
MAMRARYRVVALVIVIAAIVAVIGVSVGHANPPPPALPPVSAQRLVSSTFTALTEPLSIAGDVRTVVDLGLPQLPSGLGAGPGGAITSLTGTQRFKVWRSPDGVRVAHLLDFGEQTLVANRVEAWSWDSSDMTAQHVVYADLKAAAARERQAAPAWLRNVVPASDDGARLPSRIATIGDPIVLAARLLRSLAPFAHVTVDGTAEVAGRPAYRLVLTPTSPLTLIGRIAVDVDASTRLPLDVQVQAKGQGKPALEAGFTSVSFGAIDPSMFVFTPPPGSTVATPSLPRPPSHRPSGARPDVRVFGRGFDTRLAIRLRQDPPGPVGAVLPYAGPLASAMTVERAGHVWLLVGFVGLDTLRADAARLT